MAVEDRAVHLIELGWRQLSARPLRKHVAPVAVVRPEVAHKTVHVWDIQALGKSFAEQRHRADSPWQHTSRRSDGLAHWCRKTVRLPRESQRLVGLVTHKELIAAVA